MPKILQTPQMDPELLVTGSLWPIIKVQMWGFAVFNILLGYGLFTVHATTTFIVADGDLMLKLWAAFFLIMGVAKIYALKRENTTLLQKVIFIVIAGRSMWLLALLLRILLGGSILIAALWSIILFIELINYIFLLKKTKKRHELAGN